jgi:transposase-like protein
MPERRRKFSPEYRDEAVKMVLDGPRSIAQVARDLGINPALRHEPGSGGEVSGRHAGLR